VEKKKIAIASIGVLALLGLGVLVRKIDTPAPKAEALSSPSAADANGSSNEERVGRPTSSGASSGYDGSALAATIRDAKVREEMRRRIMEAFAARAAALAIRADAGAARRQDRRQLHPRARA
jgi:hypothetical protein